MQQVIRNTMEILDCSSAYLPVNNYLTPCCFSKGTKGLFVTVMCEAVQFCIRCQEPTFEMPMFSVLSTYLSLML